MSGDENTGMFSAVRWWKLLHTMDGFMVISIKFLWLSADCFVMWELGSRRVVSPGPHFIRGFQCFSECTRHTKKWRFWYPRISRFLSAWLTILSWVLIVICICFQWSTCVLYLRMWASLLYSGIPKISVISSQQITRWHEMKWSHVMKWVMIITNQWLYLYIYTYIYIY